MNIKTLVILILVGISFASYAQNAEHGDEQERGSNQRNNSGRQNGVGQTGDAKNCDRLLNQVEQASRAAKTANPNAPYQPSSGDLEKARRCSVLKSVSKQNGSDIASTDVLTSARNEIVCKMTSGYSLDFKACANAVKALNIVVNTEAAMALQQQVRSDLSNKNIQEKTVKQAAAGNLTTGVFDATIESNKFAKGLEQEKALAYSASVAALGSTYAKWEKPEKMLTSACTNIVTVEAKAKFSEVMGAPQNLDCRAELEGVHNDLFPNKQVKAVLATKISEYIAKGVAAGIRMNQYDTRAAAVEKVKDALTPDEEDVMMQRCVFNPTDPACSKSTTRTPGNGFSQGEFSLGNGGSNSFTMDPVTSDFGEEGNPSTVDQTVAGTNSPFLDEAKEAKGIVDPAAAAQITPTGGAGGGGGVGGGGGGGSASLGSDLEGASKDSDKDPTLKTSKASGNYAFGGGGGYSAVKGGKDDANPFASLFDSKSAGGVEEDRSIASGDIDGAASGLFQKISKRYNMIQSEKRIEANNLE